MISKIEENLGVLVGLEDWTTSSSLVSLKDSNDVLGSNIFAFVVDLAPSIDISTWGTLLGWLVEKLAFEWVSPAASNIIVSEVDDLVLWDSLRLEHLVSMAGISLMSIVGVGV
jgi:hypothetical protein